MRIHTIKFTNELKQNSDNVEQKQT